MRATDLMSYFSIADLILFLVGLALIGSGLALAFQRREARIVLPMLCLGTICLALADPNIVSFAFKAFGIDAELTKQLKNAANDAAAQFAQNNQKIQSLSDAVDRQSALDQDLSSRIATLEGKLNLPKINQNTIISAESQAVQSNRKYTVLIFFRDSRNKEASTLKQKLLEAGYQAATINSSLSETTIGPQPDGSEYVVYNQSGKDILNALKELIRQNLPGAEDASIGSGGPYSLRRGDAQIYLF